jgi:hypothetical protein
MHYFAKSVKARIESCGRALAVAGLVALCTQRAANAALEVSIDGGTPMTGTSPFTDNATVAGFGISFNVTESNSPGTGTQGELQINSLDINTNTNTGPATITIEATDTNFTMPVGPLMNLQNSVGGTFTPASPTDLDDKVTFQSFADPGNSEFGQTVSTLPISASYPTSVPPNFTSFSGNDNQAWTRGMGSYSLTNLLTITLDPNSTVANVSGATVATAVGSSVPEPTLGVIPALALGLLARRRRHSARAR